MPSVITPCGGGGSGGIKYVTYPQSGLWLYSETTDASGAPNGFGVEFKDTGGGIFYHTTGQFIAEGATGAVLRTLNGNVSITANGTNKSVNITGNAQVHTTSKQFYVDTDNGVIYLDSAGLYIQSFIEAIKTVLASGKVFTIYASNGTTKLFEVRDDFTVHIKTGQTVQADL